MQVLKPQSEEQGGTLAALPQRFGETDLAKGDINAKKGQVQPDGHGFLSEIPRVRKGCKLHPNGELVEDSLDYNVYLKLPGVHSNGPK